MFRQALLALALLLPSCSNDTTVSNDGTQELRELDPAAIVAPLLADAGEVTTNGQAAGRVPIYVLPESHNSLQQQREQALILVRMHRKLGISTIVLEGATDIRKQPEPMTIDAAYGLFTEGDISSAEFMAAGFSVPLTAGESNEIYAVEEPTGSLCHLISNMASLDAFIDAGEDEGKIQELKEKREDVARRLDATAEQNAFFLRSLDQPGTLDCPNLVDKSREMSVAANAILAELVPTSSRFEPIFARNCPISVRAHPSPSQIEAEIKDIDTLAEFANQIPPELVKDEKAFLSHQRAFLQSRADATRLMSERAVAAAADATAPVVMIVGAAHEQGVIDALQAAGAPFAVISTISLKNDGEGGGLTGDSLGPGEYSRKIERKPARNIAINRAIEDNSTFAKPSCPAKLKKPPLSVYERWARRKADIYDLSGRFATAALAGGGGLPPPPPPAGWQNDSASIDPSGVSFKKDPTGVVLGVAFPLTIKAGNESAEKKVWFYVEKRDAQTDTDPVGIETRLHNDVKEGRQLNEMAKVAFLSRTLKARTYESSEELDRMEKLSRQ